MVDNIINTDVPKHHIHNETCSKPFDRNAYYQNLRSPPFLTQENKWSPERNAIKKNIPGPGAYNIGSDLNKGKVVAINVDKGINIFYNQ